MCTEHTVHHTILEIDVCIQWNLSNSDTNGAVTEVSSFQRFKCMQELYLGWEKVSFLERCPYFRDVLIERGSTADAETERE